MIQIENLREEIKRTEHNLDSLINEYLDLWTNVHTNPTMENRNTLSKKIHQISMEDLNMRVIDKKVINFITPLNFNVKVTCIKKTHLQI
jgi:hypothetical protein